MVKLDRKNILRRKEMITGYPQFQTGDIYPTNYIDIQSGSKTGIAAWCITMRLCKNIKLIQTF